MGAKAYNTGNEIRARATQDRMMNAAAQSYSNYRVAQAQARQAALNNMMSLYNGPNDVLAGISGGRGADLSRAQYNPFSATPGYFNVGRAAPAQPYGGAPGGPRIDSLSTTTNGSFVGLGGTGGNGAQLMSQSRGDTLAQGDQAGSIINPLATGAPTAPPRQIQGNPFVYNPGGRR